MSTKTRKSGLLSAPFFSPLGFLRMSLMLATIFGVVHLLGLRHYTSVISFTHDPNVSMLKAGFYGSVYLIVYMGFTLLCPVFVLAAGVFALLQRDFKKGTGTAATDS